jgi:hypothetical protein
MSSTNALPAVAAAMSAAMVVLLSARGRPRLALCRRAMAGGPCQRAIGGHHAAKDGYQSGSQDVHADERDQYFERRFGLRECSCSKQDAGEPAESPDPPGSPHYRFHGLDAADHYEHTRD